MDEQTTLPAGIKLVFSQGESGWWFVTCPTRRGFLATGKTIAEAAAQVPICWFDLDRAAAGSNPASHDKHRHHGQR